MNEDKNAALKAIDELYARAQCSSQAGNHEEAARLFARIGNHPQLGVKRAIFLLLAAEEHADLQQCDKAIGLREQAIAVDPTSAQGWGALGRALYYGGRNSEAISAFQRSIGLMQTTTGFVQLGAAQRREGLPDQAEESFRSALEIEPNFDEAHYNLGWALFDQGRPFEAMASFNEAIQCSPDYGVAYLALGEVYHHLGMTEDAAANLRICLSLKPLDERARELLAEVDRSREDF